MYNIPRTSAPMMQVIGIVHGSTFSFRKDFPYATSFSMKPLHLQVNIRRSTSVNALTSLGISMPWRASRTAYVRVHHRKIHSNLKKTNHARPSLHFDNLFWGYEVLGCARRKNNLGRCCSNFGVNNPRRHTQFWGGKERRWRDCWVHRARSERWLDRLDRSTSTAPTGGEMVKVESLHLCIVNYWAEVGRWELTSSVATSGTDFRSFTRRSAFWSGKEVYLPCEE